MTRLRSWQSFGGQVVAAECVITGPGAREVTIEVDVYLPGWPVFCVLGYRGLSELWLYRDEEGRWRTLFHVEFPHADMRGDRWPSAASLVERAFPELLDGMVGRPIASLPEGMVSHPTASLHEGGA
ncbi:MAG: hypothetical protein AB7P52_17655 [Alphaproteobacteria bacterium]